MEQPKKRPLWPRITVSQTFFFFMKRYIYLLSYTTTRRRSILLYKEREAREIYQKESSIYTSHNNIYTFFDIYTIRKKEKKEKR